MEIGRGEISVGKRARIRDERFGIVPEDEEIKAEGRLKPPGESHAPANPERTRGKTRSARFTDKLEALGRKLFRPIKKLPTPVVDKFIRGRVRDRDLIIEKPVELTGVRIYSPQRGEERKIRWIYHPKRGINRKRIQVYATKNSTREGIVVDYLIGNEYRDLALIPTIISAALKRRISKGNLLIRPEDIKVKKKMVYSRLILMIVLDTSLSMKHLLSGLFKAIINLKFAAWRKRDKVGLVICSGDEAKVLVPPTNNINIIKRNIVRIRLGGGTPLADGMFKALEIVRLEKTKDPDVIPLVIIISDGLANASLKRKIPEDIYEICPIVGAADAIYVAYKYRRQKIPTIVINPLHEPDAEPFLGWNPTMVLERIARITKGIYIGLDPMRQKDVAQKVFDTIFSAINSIIKTYTIK